ncbi:MAG: response regulator transcription factor [Bdellovibrionales bacterium]|nr:response regulator transcription factor [Bdellovibrionales bacterium]
MRMEVLVVEDDARLHPIIEQTLKDGFKVTFSTRAAEAREEMRKKPYQMVILDVNLPDGHGFDLCRHLRHEQGTELPILFLSGVSAVNQLVEGLSAGADDYITKPFHPEELLARVKARSRRQRANGSYGKLRLDWDMQKAFVEGDLGEKDVFLTPVEFRILATLARAQEGKVTRERLLQLVWGKDIHVGARSVDKHVCTLRRKLGACSSYIRTLPNEGYQFQSEN